VTVILSEDAGDGSETPVLVRLVELGRADTSVMETGTEGLELRRVASGQVNVGGVLVGRATEQVRVFNGCMSSLHGLLRERNVAARDGVQVRLVEVLQLHGILRWVEERASYLQTFGTDHETLLEELLGLPFVIEYDDCITWPDLVHWHVRVHATNLTESRQRVENFLHLIHAHSMKLVHTHSLVRRVGFEPTIQDLESRALDR
jgi:hypothetical protein